jgi:hypothetical protein
MPLDKSKAGKLDWKLTADRKAFVTSIGGNTMIRIWLVTETELKDPFLSRAGR